MSCSHYLNGRDYLMLGFDHELRRNGFAGNSCQIVLELAGAISAHALEARLQSVLERYPILGGRPAGLLRPKWKCPIASQIEVRTHRDSASVRQRLFNEPLSTKRGQLLRFDLLEQEDGTNLIFTWAHALMDAAGAEYFLAVTGREDLSWPEAALPKPQPSTMSLPARFKTARKNLLQIDRFGETAPKSLGRRKRGATVAMRYRVERFTAAETAQVRDNGVRHCGPLGAARYHAAVALSELHQLHRQLSCPSPSYVLPMPVGLRRKGSVEPIFSNQVTMLMTQLLPEHLTSVPQAIAALKAQTEESLREGLIESSCLLSDLFRFLPLPIFMGILKTGLRGEICSLFYGDTGVVNPLLTQFLGAAITDFTHVAPVTPSPGLGVIYYSFSGLLRVTIVSLDTVLAETEVKQFASSLRARLLTP